MARIATITNEQILQAARSVFLEQGINATTVDVATRAGISSASIFKRYPTKEALLFASMSQLPDERVWTPDLEAAVGHGDPKADLLLIARRIAAYTSELVPRMMLMRSLGQQQGQPHDMPRPPRVEHDFAAMTAYFGREMGMGRIARGDPTVPALALMHATAGFAISQVAQPMEGSFDISGFLEDFVNMLWRGLETKEGA